MTLLLLSAIPLLILLVAGTRLSNRANFWLAVLTLPFFVQLAFYGLILGIGIFVASMLFWEFRKWLIRRKYGKTNIEIIYHTRR